MLWALEPLRKTVVSVGSVVYQVGMFPTRMIGRLAGGITRAIHARASAKSSGGLSGGPIKDLWLVVGLGNPGTRYDGTRHNIGFRAVDEVARAHGIALASKLKANAQVGVGSIAGESVMLVKPMTFMNLSGESVGKLSRYYKVPKEKVLVIYDDLDLPNAKVKLKLRGGHGGHNGMRSIIEHFGGKSDFPRLRIGIGRPVNKRIPIPKHVLMRFAKEEQEDIAFAVADCVKIVENIMVNGLDKALSTSNQKKNPKTHNNRPPKKKKVKSEKEDVSEGDAQSEPIVASAGDGEVGG